MTDARLQNRVAIITGASSGLGKATALRFAASGARVVVADLRTSGVEDEITTQHGRDSAIFIQVDVTQENSIQNLITQSAVFGNGRVDILCNYAGVGLETKYEDSVQLHEAKTEHFDLTWAINVRGGWLCNKYFIQQILKQEPQEANTRGEKTKGWILNVASVYGLVGGAGVPMYCPSKHAVVGMTKSMAASYAADRIHVNCVCPGYTKTPMIATVTGDKEKNDAIVGLHPWGSLGEASDIADAALYLCSDEAAWVTGQCLAVDGGFTSQ